MNKSVIGRYCIIRGDRSGVFAGIVQEAVSSDRETRLEDAKMDADLPF